MSEEPAQPAAEFLFGRLSTTAGRVDAARKERQGFFDVAILEALDPQPGEPIRLRFRCGADVSLTGVRVFWTTDGAQPEWEQQATTAGSTQATDARSTDLTWDTLTWGYVQEWEAELPAQPEGVLLQYVAVGYDTAGRCLPCPSPGRDRHGSPHIAAVSVDRLESPAWFRHAVIYQVFADRFAPTPGASFAPDDDLSRRLGGTLWGLIERLDALADLGIDTLWITPIFASPDYHGYATSDFLQVEPALGGHAAWQELVTHARRLKLRLVLDFVANHVSDQHPAFVAARQSADAATRSWFRFLGWPDKYAGFFDQASQPELDAEQAAAREHLIAAAVQWLRQGCDGFRLDHAHGLSHSFWSHFRAATRAAAPDSVCFGEITQTPQVVRSYAGRLDGCLDFAMCDLLRETFGRGNLTLSEFDRRLQRHLTYFQDRLVLPSFLDNHDMNRFLLLAGGDRRRLKVAALVQFLMPGPPVIYYGTEIGLSQRRPVGPLEEARLPMPTSDTWNCELRKFYRDLIRLRQQCELSHAVPVLLWVDDTAQSAAWRMGSVELVVNLGSKSSFPVQGRRVLLATDPAVTQVSDDGRLRVPSWSAAALSSG